MGETCGTPLACRYFLKEEDGRCSGWHYVAEDTACVVSEWLPPGTCDGWGACEIPDAPGPTWGYRPDVHGWRLAGQLPAGAWVVSESGSPRGGAIENGYSVCRLARFDSTSREREQPLHPADTYVPCHPWVLHGRHAVGRWRWPDAERREPWSVVTLDGSGEVRDVSLLQQVRATLPGVADTLSGTEPALWAQGPAGQLLLAWRLMDGRVWVGSLDLHRLDFTWTRLFEASAAPAAIADEQGRLYLSLGTRLVALDTRGEVRWTLEQPARAVAVFRDTLFTTDGRVRSPETGVVRYAWDAADGAYVLLSETHAAVVSPVGKDTRLQLLARGEGVLLSEAVVAGAEAYLGASYPARVQTPAAFLTRDGRVLLVQRVGFPAMMSSPYYGVYGVRLNLLGAQGLQVLGEWLAGGNWVESAVLEEEQLIAVARDPWHNDDSPGADLQGYAVPGLVPPEHGWQGLAGNVAGGSAPY